MSEKTLLIIKPDALSKKLMGKIISEIEQNGLRITGTRMLRLSESDAGSFYKEHKGKDFYGPLIDFMTSNPVVVMAVEGDDAISRARTIIGATDPAEADEGTIRKKWARDGRHNIIHGSDSPESAERELEFFFPGGEGIIAWEDKEYIL